jgi:hypothetical protein
MRTKKFNTVMGIFLGISLAVACVLFVLAGGYLGQMPQHDQLIWYASIPAFIGLIILVTMFIVNIIAGRNPPPMDRFGTPAINDKERKRAKELYKQRVEDALQKARGKREEIVPTDIIFVEKYTAAIKKDDICMVCKLFIDESDEVLQCPICEVLYHEEHLLEWITKQKHCPVCATELYKKE